MRFFLFFILLIGCTHSSDRVKVYVSAYSSTDMHEFSEEKYCFDTENMLKANEGNIEVQSYIRRITDKCSLIARTKKVQFTKESSGCMRATLTWSLPEGQKWEGPTVTHCSGAAFGSEFGATSSGSCVSGKQTGTGYSKGIEFQFFDLNGKMVHKRKASMISKTPGMQDGTINALCRAIFADFPNDFENNPYSASTTDFDLYRFPWAIEPENRSNGLNQKNNRNTGH